MISEAREYVAQALEPLGIPIHAYPPGTVAPPAAVITPGDPYYRPQGLSGDSAVIGLDVLLVTSGAAGDAGRKLDDLIHAAAQLIGPTAARLSEVLAITQDSEGGPLMARLPVTIHWRE